MFPFSLLCFTSRKKWFNPYRLYRFSLHSRFLTSVPLTLIIIGLGSRQDHRSEGRGREAAPELSAHLSRKWDQDLWAGQHASGIITSTRARYLYVQPWRLYHPVIIRALPMISLLLRKSEPRTWCTCVHFTVSDLLDANILHKCIVFFMKSRD